MAEAKQSTRWPKGVSGNPAGRPKGARHKYLVAIEALLDGEAEGLTRKAIELALAGDTTALRLSGGESGAPAMSRRLSRRIRFAVQNSE